MNATKQDINRFAMKWLEKYQDKHTSESELEELFSQGCFALGFTMDCGESFITRYGEAPFQNALELQKVSNIVYDLELLTSAIFSRWRYYTHWTCSPIDREWFVRGLIQTESAYRMTFQLLQICCKYAEILVRS